MKKLLTVAILIVLIASACQAAAPKATATPAPTATPSVPPTPTPLPALFSDDFSGEKLNWSSFPMVARQPDLVDGAAHFILSAAGLAVAASTGATLPQDVVIESDVTIANDTGTNVFGIACRLEQTFNGKAYLFYVGRFNAAADRVAGINIYDPTSSTATNLAEQPLTGDLLTANEMHLQAQCIGTKLFLLINGQNIVGIDDSTLTEGVDAGMFAYGNGYNAEILFDNFIVRAPTADQSAAARLPTLKAP
jgi:hypothetical protein